MAKGAYVGVSSKARKIKKIYVGVGGKARKVKKAYVGVAGKARLWWNGGDLSYYGTAKKMSYTRSYYAGASTTDYAIFAGGRTASGYSSICAYADAYTSSLTLTSMSALSVARDTLCGVSTSDKSHVLFAGGRRAVSGAYSSPQVDSYDNSLTLTSTTTNLSDYLQEMASANAGDYALFAGGWKFVSGSTAAPSDKVVAYNNSCTRTVPSSLLSQARYGLGGASVGDYALFGGGGSSQSISSSNVTYKTVDAYNSSLTRSIATSFSYGRLRMYSASHDGYALFAEGCKLATSGNAIWTTSDTNLRSIECYNSSLTHSTVSTATVDHPYGYTIMNGAAASLGRFSVFCGGEQYYGWSGVYVISTVLSVDDQLTVSSLDDLASATSGYASAVVGDYMIFPPSSGPYVYAVK